MYTLLAALCLAAPPFAEPPLAVYDRLRQQEKLPAMSAGERELLAAVYAPKTAAPPRPVELTDGQLADLLLFASGVEEPADRAKYRAMLAELATAVAAAVKGKPDPGEVLLTFLHDRAFPKGYDADQTTVSGVFDTGAMNCVSSAALYAYLGRRAGLTLTAVGIPGTDGKIGHAALDLHVGGVTAFVEPTNRHGFDPTNALKRAGRQPGPAPDRTDAYPTDLYGLAGMVYVNRGTALGKRGRPDRAGSVRADLCGLCLDPADPTAAHNLAAAFTNWGFDALTAGDPDTAVRVLGFGRELFPAHAKLKDNQKAAFAGAVKAAVAAGRDADAVRLLSRAQAAVPDDGDFADGVKWFQIAAQELPAGDYPARLAVYDRAAAVLPGAAADLAARRTSLYREWSQARLEAGDVAGSAAALARGFARTPADRGLRDGVAYHTQEALKRLDPAAVAGHVADLRQRFPGVPEVGEMAASHAARVVRGLADGGKFAEAVGRAAALKPMLGDGHAEAVAGVYDAWGRKLADGKEWEAAVDKYKDGAAAAPAAGWLANNAEVLVDQWAKPMIAASDWAGALKAYDAGLKRFPASAHLAHNRKVCGERQAAGG